MGRSLTVNHQYMQIKHRKYVNKKLVKFLLVLSTFFTILLFSKFLLIKNERINANLLIVEGWLPDLAIQMISKEVIDYHYDYIITTGLILGKSNYYEMAYNGYLIFYPKLIPKPFNLNNHHRIEILAHSKKGGKYCAHFNFSINDTLISDFLVDKSLSRYTVIWEGDLNKIDSLVIQFDNDLVDNWGDRNLYIKEIIINSNIIIPYQYNSEYDIGLMDGKERINNNFNSFAEIAKNRLIAYGIDPSKVIAVPGKSGTMNRTFTSAMAFQEWLKNTDIKVKGINIATLDLHSRRTFMTYRKVLGKSYDIGILSFSEKDAEQFNISNIFRILYEIIGIIYYLIIFIFIHT